MSEEPPPPPAEEAAPVAPGMGTYPPYPPYEQEVAAPTVADTIKTGKDMRIQFKVISNEPAKPPPYPAKPRGPKPKDVNLSRRAALSQAKCLRRHGAVLTDRLEYISKPPRRQIINLWRDFGDKLPPDTVYRFRNMLDADVPFKPGQAYEYFINLRRAKKMSKAHEHPKQIKDILSIYSGDKRYLWARNACVAFAKGVQQRLAKPGCYYLADGMLRLSNIILNDLCSFMHMRPPRRRPQNPKSKFMLEISDKVAVWIDEILSESEDRMLMMDFDEDEDIRRAEENGDFADDFLDMMGGGSSEGLFGPSPAYLMFTGDMLTAFRILTNSMTKRGDEKLLSYGKFNETYKGASNELKTTQDLQAKEYNSTLASQLNKDLAKTVKNNTPANIQTSMKSVVEICGKYLAQHAEYNKDKGPGFKHLVKIMKAKPEQSIYQNGKASKTLGTAATELENANGLESDHDDPNLTQQIHSTLSALVEGSTPADMKNDMAETLDTTSKYLSQRAIDEIERGPAFDILIESLEKSGAKPFTPENKHVPDNFSAAYTLKSAPGLSGVVPDNATAPMFKQKLHEVVDKATPPELKKDMQEVVARCGDYLSAFVRDRDEAMRIILKQLNANPNKALVKRGDHTLNYGPAATEVAVAPTLISFLPVKDIATDTKKVLTNETKNVTPPELIKAMKSAVQDVSNYLSQGVAIKSGAAGERYKLNFLAAVTKSLGEKPLYKYKTLGHTYKDGAQVLEYAGPLESDPKADDLKNIIQTELATGLPERIAPTIQTGLDATIDDASKHLAKVGVEKEGALNHVVDLMKKQGSEILVNMQGYDQSYADGARRIENAPTLANDKVDKNAYENVKQKLTDLTTKMPNEKYAKDMPGVVDDASKFLAQPAPENAVDEGTANLSEKINGRDAVNEGSAHLSGKDKGRDAVDEGSAHLSGKVKGRDAVDEGTANLSEKINGRDRQAASKDDEDEARRRRKEAELIKDESQRVEAQAILHKQLWKKGDEPLHRAQNTNLTHKQGSEWLNNEDNRIDQSVKVSPDTARLHKKFEKKLSALVEKQTPDELVDAMQDVVIESSRILSEKFVSASYKEQVKKALILEMQKRKHEPLIQVNDVEETYFFAAQRMKKNVVNLPAPSTQLAYTIQKKLDDMVRCRTMARKLINTMRDEVKETADILSTQVTKPDESISAYVALLEEMETGGDSLLVGGETPKSYKDAVAYLYTLTSNEDQINIPDSSLQSAIESKLHAIMTNVPHCGYTKCVLYHTIRDTTRLLVSYIKLTGGTMTTKVHVLIEKYELNTASTVVFHPIICERMTRALKLLVDEMNEAGDSVLLRHGNTRKSYKEGAALLAGKKVDELEVTNVDPVVERKIQIKLVSLMDGRVPKELDEYMNDVIRNATSYLAFYLLKPQVVKVCKCMKNVVVQCELRCDEILRHVSRSCCSCTPHVCGTSPSDLTRERPQINQVSLKAPGREVSFVPCPSSSRNALPAPCPAITPTEKCNKSVYFMQTTSQCEQTTTNKPTKPPRSSYTSSDNSTVSSLLYPQLAKDFVKKSLTLNMSSEWSYYTPTSTELSVHWPITPSENDTQSFQEPSRERCEEIRRHFPQRFSKDAVSLNSGSLSNSSTVRTDQMGDWHSMMVSLMWNVQSWRDWIQENIDRGRMFVTEYDATSAAGVEGSWANFEQRVAKEAIQWRHYNTFSHKLTLRLIMRYKDKQIVSPSSTVKTKMYMDCQQEMLSIMDMFIKWTLWLLAVVKETGALEVTEEDASVDFMRWCYFKCIVEKYEEDWIKYNMHLKVCWEHKYRSLIADWQPAWKHPGPVWVVSAFGAVPSGATAAGLYQGEVTWVARTTHKCNVLPAALLSSKHCCLVYADGAVHKYTKYQVMCNAEAIWMAWRAGNVATRAVQVTPGVHVGRVYYHGSHLLGPVQAPHYRCHVIIFGRPFAFNCFELLVLAETE